MADVNWGSLLDDSADAFEILPVGKYRMKVIKAEATQASTGKLMFKVVMEVITGPKTGKSVYNNITMTTDNKKALYMFFVNMAALGISEAYLKSSPAPTSEQVAAKMVGAVADVTIDHSTWQGRDRENVKGMTAVSAGTGSVNSMTPSIPQPAAAAPAAAAPAGDYPGMLAEDAPVENPGAPKLPF